MSELSNKTTTEASVSADGEQQLGNEKPKFLNYWHELAGTYPDIAEVCLDNAQRVDKLREALFEGNQIPESFMSRAGAARELYLSYGSFNTMSGGEMDLARLAQIFLADEHLAVDTNNPREFLAFVSDQTSNEPPSEMKMLAGCCLYEMGMLHDNMAVREKLLLTARGVYESITESDVAWSCRYKEEAHQYQSDIDFYLVTSRPDISSQQYQQVFVGTQLDQLGRLQNIVDEGVSTGFLWEEYYQLSARRLLWESYSADKIDIRTSLPRQDMPHDGLAPNGFKKQAFDAVVSEGDVKSFLQLKSYKGQGSEESYIDDIDLVDIEGEALRRKIQNELVAIEMAYIVEGRNLRSAGNSARRTVEGDVKNLVAGSVPGLE